MTNRAGSDAVSHFKAGWEVLKRYPVLLVPPLGAQVIVVVLAVLFLGSVAGLTVAGGLAGGLAGLLAGGALFMLLGGLLSLIASGVVIVMARDALAAREPVMVEALNAVIARFLDVLVASLLLTLIVGVGMLFFVVPGLLAAFFLIFTLPAVLLEGQGAVDALRRSAYLVKENIGPVAGLVIGGILAAVVTAIVSRILEVVPILGHLAAALLAGVFITYLSVVGVRVYQSLPRR